MELSQLQSILEKNPTIYTYSAQELIASPDRIEQKYRLHAKTHLSLPDLQQYEDRLLSNVLQNQGAFIGGLFGEYGLGKTSTLLHLWTVCEDNGLLAVPPYEWRHFSENYEALYRWVRYRLGQTTPALTHDLDKVYLKYTSPSIEKLAKEAAEKYSLPFDQAHAFIQRQWESGILRPDLPEEAYLDFLAEVTEIARAAHYKGLIVFHDELQVAVEALSLSKVADILFRLSASMVDRTGNYGLFIGMPLSTQTALLAERKDIFDRLQRQRCFIDLSLAYTLDFPRRLWESFADKFGFREYSAHIVQVETLEAVGQICNPGRRDLGNGPRSVISAFNRIVQYHVEKALPYSVEQFVDDCLKGEIVMGQESRFAKNLSEVLGQPFVKGRFESLVKVMAAFPLGAPQSLFQRFGLAEDLKELVQKAFHEIVYENANGYALVCLRPSQVASPVAFLETKIRQFHRTFAADTQHAALAAEGFKNFILPAIFTAKDGMQGFQPHDGNKTWQWSSDHGSQSTVLTGTFDTTLEYPQRVVRLTVGTLGKTYPGTGDDEQFRFCFHLKWKDGDTDSGTVGDLAQWSVTFHLDLMEVLSDYNIPTITPGILPSGHMTPMFLLALAEHLRTKANVPKTEEREAKFVLEDIVGKLTVRMFDASHQTVVNTDIRVDTIGRRLVADVFWSLCKKRFPKYHTLIIQAQWQKKIAEYAKVLELSRVPLSVARGNEAYDPGLDLDVPKKRQLLGQLLGVNASSIESWGAPLKDIIDTSRAKTDGTITFKPHPLELEILEMIQACPAADRIKVNGKMCQAVDGVAVITHCRSLGYTDEEIQAVMGLLGQARKYFQLTNRGGQSYLYYEPVSIEELRDQLSEKLVSLHSRVNNLKTIRGFSHGTVDFASYETSLAKVQSTEDFEKLRQAIHGHFERINRWIAAKFADLATDVEKAGKITHQEFVTFENTGQLGALKQKLDGQAAWIPDLSKLQSQLNSSYDRTKSGWQLLWKESQQLTAYGRDWSEYHAVEIAQVGDEKLTEYHEQVQAHCEQVAEFAARFKTLKQDITAFNPWVRLKQVSDRAWSAALLCQSMGHTAVITRFQSLSESVCDHLQKYGRDGLKDSERFLKDLQELEASAENFKAEQRRAFLVTKESFQQLLREVLSNVSVLRSQFSDTSPSSSYTSLYEETWEGFLSVIRELISSFAQLSSDLRYASEYLQRSPIVEEGRLLIRAEAGKARAEQLVRFTISSDYGVCGIEEIARAICSLREEYASLLAVYRQDVLRPETPSPEEQKLLDLLGKTDTDLKEVIMALSNGHHGVDLNEVLSTIASLFRKNQLVLKVRRSS